LGVVVECFAGFVEEEDEVSGFFVVWEILKVGNTLM
jgi:hypothetical protein